mmetsp:Transcript_19945/g.43109  ORF Transcript_19945/g.43109 Transcript_19945/m.43109 type:complete len:275 (+) Transcript_19945:650-1474(+)
MKMSILSGERAPSASPSAPESAASESAIALCAKDLPASAPSAAELVPEKAEKRASRKPADALASPPSASLLPSTTPSTSPSTPTASGRCAPGMPTLIRLERTWATPSVWLSSFITVLSFGRKTYLYLVAGNDVVSSRLRIALGASSWASRRSAPRPPSRRSRHSFRPRPRAPRSPSSSDQLRSSVSSAANVVCTLSAGGGGGGEGAGAGTVVALVVAAVAVAASAATLAAVTGGGADFKMLSAVSQSLRASRAPNAASRVPWASTSSAPSPALE